MTVTLEQLLSTATKEEIYETAITIAQSLGLPVSSWQPGDPTRSLYHIESEILATLNTVVEFFIKSGFVDYAEGEWLELLADQYFGVTVPAATRGTCSVTLTNTGGGVFVIAAGDLTFRNSDTGATYHNTTGGTLNGGGTLDLDVEADVEGTDGSAGIGDIDELVTTLLGVTVTNTTAAVGADKASDATIRALCKASLARTSDAGPEDAYVYVATNSALTGTSNITRARAYGDSTTGLVDVYLASSSGGVTSDDRDKAEEAIMLWATPICITPTVASAVEVPVDITYEAWVYSSTNDSETEIEAKIETALGALFAELSIGGDIIPPATTGKLYTSRILATIRAQYAECFRVDLTVPAADVALGNDEVATLGTITATIHKIEGP